MARLSDEQRRVLLLPVAKRRVLVAQGQAHLPAYDVVAYLNRVFGIEFWDREILEMTLMAEDGVEKGGRVGWTTTFLCRVRLTIRNTDGEVVKISDGCATGTASNLPSRGDALDFSCKNADSYALKRAAKDLGDQFGLSLYRKGSLEPVVRESVAYGNQLVTPDPEATTIGNDERVEPEVVQADAKTRLLKKMEAISERTTGKD